MPRHFSAPEGTKAHGYVRLTRALFQKLIDDRPGSGIRTWGDPDEDGYYSPIVTRNYDFKYIKPFVLTRIEDESGVSGTGDIAEGVVFSDGTAVLRWVSAYKSTAIYDSIDTLIAIHGHDGKTVVDYEKQFAGDREKPT